MRKRCWRQSWWPRVWLLDLRRPALTPPDLVRYRGPIEHIFVHPLMPSPRYTLHRGTQPQEFNKWSITAQGSSAGCCRSCTPTTGCSLIWNR